MDAYKRITQAYISYTNCNWGYRASSNQLSSISAWGIQGYTYSFDANTGNLNAQTNSLKSKTESFEYDTEMLDCLTEVTGPVDLSVGYTT